MSPIIHDEQIFLSFVLIEEIGKSLCQSVVSPAAWDAELLGAIVVKGLKDMLQICDLLNDAEIVVLPTD